MLRLSLIHKAINLVLTPVSRFVSSFVSRCRILPYLLLGAWYLLGALRETNRKRCNIDSNFETFMSQNALSYLPVEIHSEILKNVLYLSQHAARHDDGLGSIKTPVKWKWIEDDCRDISQFPYNVAAVCKLWLDVLSRIPQCWTRVIIDVAFDPSKFLDIFLWSKDLPKLEVTIFNSHTHHSNNVDDSSVERQRVSAIVDALRPHISRCKIITFDLTFLTSLPSPMFFLLEDAPHLKKLVLECKVDNAGSPEDYSSTCDFGVSERTTRDLTSLPKLQNLSITGFWFMLSAGHPFTAECFKENSAQGIDFCISRFQFQQEGHYTLQNFVSYCSRSRPESITMRNLSLNHDGVILERRGAFSTEVMEFDNVTADVLRSLFSMTLINPTHLIFDNCVLPDDLPSTSIFEELTLRNTSNLRSILSDHSGFFTLNVESCPSFDDSVFSALLGHQNLQSISFSDCNNFTVHGIREFLQANYQPDNGYEGIETLSIHGDRHCPFPSEEDRRWFRRSASTNPIEITWSRNRQLDLQAAGDSQTFYKPPFNVA